ncbi:MAG: oprF 5 [Bacteroidetes bacterium]|nr:oprF 5 [Bacteroidota bacterium]
MKAPCIFVFLFFALNLVCQTEDKLHEADELFNNKRYAAAFSIYHAMWEKDKDNPTLNYKIGVCYLHSRSLKHKAAAHFEKYTHKNVPSSENKSKDPESSFIIYRYLGDAYCVNYKFDDAIIAYNLYKEHLQNNRIYDPVLSEMIERKIELCKFGKELKELVALPVVLKTEKKTKNSKPSFDSSSVLSTDKSARVFTFKVPLNKIRKFGDAKYYEDTNIEKTDSVARKTKTIKTSNGREPDTLIYVTTLGTSVDGQIVLSYKNDNGDGNLFLTSLKSNQWSRVVKLDKTVNPSGWEPNETISPDGKTLYFSSDREGGYGGKDIYYCTLQTDGEWSKAINLGPSINSPYNEEAPFIHPDGTTLYFSSNRTKPDEYYDNYTSVLISDGTWAKPIAVGYPVDKSQENVFYQVAADKKKIFPARQALSEKQLKQKQADSLRESNERDNYIISFVNSKKVPLTLLKGKVTDKTGSIAGKTAIKIINNVTRETEGIYYTDNIGHYSFILPAGKNNNISFEAENCLFQSDNVTVNTETDYYKKHHSIVMSPLAKNSKTLLNNIFFDSAGVTISKTSEVELERVLKLMKDHPEMKIQLSNYVHCTKNICYSKKFARERARTVAAWLTLNGVEKTRIQAKGYKKKKNKSGEKILTSESSLNQLELKIVELKTN